MSNMGYDDEVESLADRLAGDVDREIRDLARNEAVAVLDCLILILRSDIAALREAALEDGEIV